MLFKSQLITQASGSIGGLTASRNRGGMYFRSRAMPTNPNTIRQQAVKSILGALVQSWAVELDSGERQSWRDYGQSVPVTNRLGDQITLTGQQQFIRSNVPRLQAGLARVDSAPSIMDTGEPVTSLTDVSETMGGFDVVAALATPASDDGNALFYIGLPLTEGQEYYAGPYQLGMAAAVASAGTDATFSVDLTSPAEWLSNRIPVIGQRLGVELRISYDDGRLSQRYRQIVTVEDGA